MVSLLRRQYNLQGMLDVGGNVTNVVDFGNIHVPSSLSPDRKADGKGGGGELNVEICSVC
jgi:hypothetical protein